MEMQIIKKIKISPIRNFISYSLLFALVLLLNINVYCDSLNAETPAIKGQETSASDTNFSQQTWNGSEWVNSVVENDSKAIEEALKDAARKTKLSYIFMALGIIIVLGLAWFTQSKSSKSDDNKGVKKAPPVKTSSTSSPNKKHGPGKPRR